MKQFIKKLIERLEEKEKRCHDMALAEIMNNGHSRDAEHLLSQEDTYSNIIRIVNELAEEYKEECNFDCDKLLFAYSDLLRRFQNAEETVICEFSGNISKETEELETECEELLIQFKEILYSTNTPQKSAEEYKLFGNSEQVNGGWIPCSERLPEDDSICIVTVELSSGATVVGFGWFDRVGVCWYVGVHEFRTTNVHAWMPLPAPFTEGE